MIFVFYYFLYFINKLNDIFRNVILRGCVKLIKYYIEN